MKIKNDKSFVKFEFTEICELQGRYDISCRIEAFCDGFGGKVDSVWFLGSDVDSFILDIEKLDKTRKGAAELLNMSSGSDVSPLEFKIFTTDDLGHLAVRTILRKLVFFKDSSEISSISIVFEIDPSILPSIVRDFRKLFKM